VSAFNADVAKSLRKRLTYCGPRIRFGNQFMIRVVSFYRPLSPKLTATRELLMISEPERKVDGWDEAEEALASAQLMPVGPK
jgi:hypothetical protein